MAVMLLLLAALAYQVALVVWQLIPAPEQTATQQQSQVTRVNNNKNASANFRQQANAISRAFLFGKPDVKTAVVQAVEQAPKPSLITSCAGSIFQPRSACHRRSSK